MAQNGVRRVNKKEFRAQRMHPYSLKEILAFYRACYGIYLHITGNRPDVIVAPLRGADPIIKTVRLIASLERNSEAIPTVVYPRTGEQSALPEKKVYSHIPPKYIESMSVSEKKRELLDMLGRVVERKKPGQPVKVLLVDEAFSGGSISSHYSIIKELIRKHRWKVSLSAIAVTTRHEKVEHKSGEYVRLRSEKKIREFSVPWLFTTDSPSFLQPLIESRRSVLEWLKRSVKRPALALSREAIEGRAQLFKDIEEIWKSRVTEHTSHSQIILAKKRSRMGLGRLPVQKPR